MKVDANDVAAQTGPDGLGRNLDALAAAAPDMAAPAIRNCRDLEGSPGNGRKGGKKRVAVPLLDIARDLLTFTAGWPKRVGELPFVVKAGEVRWLDEPEKLFAWIEEHLPVFWAHGHDSDGQSLTTKAEFFAHVTQGAAVERYRAVESLPHEPPLDGHFYAWEPPKDYTPTGEHLAALLSRFDNLEAAEDALLLKALFLLPAWGGFYGARPAFVIEAPDRGCGKTTIADAVGLLYGGAVDFDLSKKSEEDLATRLLSPVGLTKRVVRIDNAKRAVSSETIERLVTSADISGKVLFHGEGNRPNTLCWIITANGLRLSRDMAERSFVIRLTKPVFRASWREDLLAFVTARRPLLIADILAELKKPGAHTGATTDRWSSFVAGVLARCGDAGAVARAVALNQQRRDSHDDELEEGQTLQEAVDGAAREDVTAGDPLRWPCEKMTETVNKALGLNLSTRKVSHLIQEHIQAGRLVRVQKHRTNAGRLYLVTRPPVEALDAPAPAQA
jgi:hypothetical protein